MRLTPRCPVGNALNDLFCVPKQMGAEIPSAEQIGGYLRLIGKAADHRTWPRRSLGGTESSHHAWSICCCPVVYRQGLSVACARLPA